MNAAIESFDWSNPDYSSIFRNRIQRLQRLRANPRALPALKLYYRDHPAQFIGDWGVTFDPRLAERGLATTMPFVLFPRQIELVSWIMERWRGGENAIVEKSRDSGCSWITVSLACTLCLFNAGLVVGFGSRKEVYVDSLNDPKSLFSKARLFLSHLPREFLGDFEPSKHAPAMRILIPATGSSLIGESGDGIGRGARTSLFFVDEAAFLERPELIDASLSSTTNCRIDVSTPCGMTNPFAIKRHSGKLPVFSFDWRADPRKDQRWLDKMQRELDPVTFASEVAMDYAASIEGRLIPSSWIDAAVNAHVRLGLTPSGERRAALDIADEGRDLNAAAFRYGVLLEHVESWSGRGGNIYETTLRMFNLCDERRYERFDFDSDGMGVGVRGDAERVNSDRTAERRTELRVYPFRGSGAVEDPDTEVVRGSGRLNRDFFANQKAQAWWSLRTRFQNTYAAVIERRPVDLDSIISLDPAIGELAQLKQELSQITYKLNLAGKVIVNKAPDGARSPNLADAAMIAFAPGEASMEVWSKLGGET